MGIRRGWTAGLAAGLALPRNLVSAQIGIRHRHAPDVTVERATRHENSQQRDDLIVPIYFVSAFGTIFIAGLDGSRFRWSGDLPVGVIVVSHLTCFSGNFLASWSVSANAFFPLNPASMQTGAKP